MIWPVAVALLACIGFAALAPHLAGHLPPVIAVRFLTVGSLIVAACAVFVLGVMALFGLGEIPVLGSWLPRAVRRFNPFPGPIGAVALVLLAILLVVASIGIARRTRALVAVYRSYLTGPRPIDQVVVLDDDRPDAFTTPAPGGRIVVTAGLLAVLTADQQRVVFAHERAHLRYRHLWWRFAADLASAVNPMLRPTAAAVAYATERWADEHAAFVTGDRQLVARTLAQVALVHQNFSPGPAVRAAATGGDVTRRVQALLAPTPTPARGRMAVVALVSLVLVGAFATAMVASSSEEAVDLAGPTITAHIAPAPGR